MAKVAITWRKSAIGYNQRQKDTIRKLGLRRLNQTVEHDDSPTLRGMIARVGHLVDVRDGEAGEAS
ncbi:MAG: 50S ribosomal protein L30 [Dehalococcoidia bacterium]|nr:50S ribosomal protein L30 [Chloroflexota bacterium]MXW25682.1 50S ribosomal protein L30 [Dehalococcoidia bacterium]MXZ88251.1 50S ribosomal protein L30 [Dehalococcoidia bacterium]MYA52776.1 50S ribosomal protein L30 [Dehalococcoidia bacterium]MYH67073.1 50S ribosomal protein L30 [Dehalococcoidia bacterium]